MEKQPKKMVVCRFLELSESSLPTSNNSIGTGGYENR